MLCYVILIKKRSNGKSDWQKTQFKSISHYLRFVYACMQVHVKNIAPACSKKKLFRKSVINFPTVKGSDPGHLVTDIWSHDISSLDIWSQPFCHQIFGHTDIWSQDKCRVTKCPPPQGLGLDPQNVSNGSIKGKFSTKKYNWWNIVAKFFSPT